MLSSGKEGFFGDRKVYYQLDEITEGALLALGLIRNFSLLSGNQGERNKKQLPLTNIEINLYYQAKY